MNIRRASESELSDIITIERASFEYPWSLESFIRQYHNPQSETLVAEVNCIIVAFLIYEKVYYGYEIVQFAVHPDYRRLGIGSKLISQVMNKGGKIKLEVRENSVIAKKFYHSHGFQIIYTVPNYYSKENQAANIMQWSEPNKELI